jgi:hypothetical protein
MISYAPGVSSKSVCIQIVDDSGLPVTGLVAATMPAISYWLAGANASVSISLSDLAAITTAYSSGGVKELSGGYYRLDVPDGAWTTAGKVKIFGEATGKRVLLEIVDVGYPQVDIRQAVGNAITTTTSGIPDVNVKNWNNQTALTDANNLPKVDVEDIRGTLSAGTAGYIGPDWGHVNAPTTTVGLTNTTISTSQVVASVSGAVGSVTGAVGSISGIAFPTNFAALLISVGGHISNVDTLTTYTGNTPQTGDAYAVVSSGTYGNSALHTQIAAIPTNPYTGTPPTTAQIATAVWQDLTAGSDFTTTGSIGKLIVTKGLTVSLAANQHVIVDSGTVTTLTNLPAITAGWLTATGIAASALNGKGDWSTYSGSDTSGTTMLLTRLTNARAGYLDNLSAGAVALAGSAPSWYVAPVDVSANVSAIKAKTDQLAFTSGAVQSILVAAGLDNIIIESGLNARQALSINSSVMAGVSAGMQTGSVTFAAAGVPATNRVSATLDVNNNRTTVTLSPPT